MAGSPRRRDGVFVDHLLVIDQYELLVALEHARQAVSQCARRPDPAVLDLYQQPAVVAPRHAAPDKLPEPAQFGFTAKKDRRLVQVGPVPVVGDDAIVGVVVEVGAGNQTDRRVVGGFVESAQQHGVGPCLVAGMRAFRFRPATPAGDHQPVLVAEPRLRPLLELDDDEIGGLVGAATGD